jgi:hypothetical protein
MMSVLAQTDMVAMLPERLARGAPGLKVVEAPLEVPGLRWRRCGTSEGTGMRGIGGCASRLRPVCEGWRWPRRTYFQG